MKKPKPYLALLIILGILLLLSIYLSNQEGARHVDLGTFFAEKESGITFEQDILFEMQEIDRYLNDSISLFSDSEIPLRFLERVRKRNAENLIRNGNLDQAEQVSHQYRFLVRRFMRMSDSLNLPMDISRKEFFKNWKSVSNNTSARNTTCEKKKKHRS